MEQWQAGWTQAVVDVHDFGTSFVDVTVRARVVTALGGDHVRLALSNRFGKAPLVIGSCAVGVGANGAAALFAGQAEATIPAGQTRHTDPVALHVQRGDQVQVDLFLPAETLPATGNFARMPVQVSAPGDHAGALQFPAIETPTIPAPDGTAMAIPLPFLHSVEVCGQPAAAVLVCLGDSITAGGWPEAAAELLAGRVEVSILNRGIAGNRLRVDPDPAIASFGLSGLSRFDDDVLATAGVTDVVIALGTNDLGLPGQVAPTDELPTAQQLIDAYQRLIAQATAAGLRTTIATITPFMGAEGYDHGREQTRTAVNAWIRTSAPSVVDFDEAVRSASHSDRLSPEFDSGDHLHPNEAGEARLAQVMADLVARRHSVAAG
ncbi:GDSL-type esterase/lipase family protein [Paractinoplanes durhamensis]|uniref:SGNH hydrolase-type esterase domain-containing protein n=1 Tax=Paractinoplanes durhamensis TaxID=113563 RepID=A0ABQ3YX79_9ACTN|nr:GDSL-type esterase/lipase family protein [Actinoplanes durhamensis]GIE02125.1 hypothetical protein Adu01nite_34750 [Actinoplanes durhamensis]